MVIVNGELPVAGILAPDTCKVTIWPLRDGVTSDCPMLKTSIMPLDVTAKLGPNFT